MTADLASNLQKIDDSPGALICTSGTRPSWGAAQDGRLIVETDTGLVKRWNNATTTFDVGNVAFFAQKANTVTAVFKGSAWPSTRPTGYAMVIWLGSSDPGSLAIAGDLWITTS